MQYNVGWFFVIFAIFWFKMPHLIYSQLSDTLCESQFISVKFPEEERDRTQKKSFNQSLQKLEKEKNANLNLKP